MNISTLEQQNKELQDRIDKAIEYINHEYFKRIQIGIADKTFQEFEVKNILLILDKKGE